MHIEREINGIVKFRQGKTTKSILKGIQGEPGTIAFSDTDPGTHLTSYSTTSEVHVTIPDIDPTRPFDSPPSGSFGKHEMPEAEDVPSAIIVEGVPPLTDTLCGFVLRIKDDDKRSLFYIAGLSEYSTKGAAYYLASEWQNLFKQYGKDKSFLVMLTFNKNDFTDWSKSFEKNLSP